MNNDMLNNYVDKISKNSKNELDKITLPNANNFNKVLNTLYYLETPRDRSELTKFNDFSNRQGYNYGNAICYLDLANKHGAKYELSNLGVKLLKSNNFNDKNMIIVKQILGKKVFNLTFANTIRNNGKFDNKYIVNILLRYGKSVNSELIAKRKAITVKNWISWILNLSNNK